MADTINYSTMSNEDLENRMKEMSEELMSAKLKHRLGQFKKTADFRRLRKEIARIKTYLQKKQAA